MISSKIRVVVLPGLATIDGLELDSATAHCESRQMYTTGMMAVPQKSSTIRLTVYVARNKDQFTPTRKNQMAGVALS